MEKIIGCVYQYGPVYVMCTGPGDSEGTFSGTVVRIEDGETSFYRKGRHTDTWLSSNFKETDEWITIDNI